MENLIESNKLIAEFLGLTQGKPNEIRWKHDWFDDKGVLNGIRNTHLLFHSDWNWLMKVIDKIESFEDENRCAKYNFITEQSFAQVIDNSTSDEIVSLDAETKIQAVYDTAVEFIKWHNLNNK